MVLEAMWLLMTDGASYFGIHGEIEFLSEEELMEKLLNHQPVICAMGYGDFYCNRSFIVITDYQEGGFVVHDPNSKKKQRGLWSYERLMPQVRNMWVYAKN